MRLDFAMDVLAADTVGRTIEGVVVPYGEAARIAGRSVTFERGSVHPLRARTPLLLDHDRKQPVGVLAALVDGAAGAYARFRVDETPAGDEALTQAASGSRGAFSIGAELEEYDELAGGALSVRSAGVVEVSLLAFGAFAGAQVQRVAAGELVEDGAEEEPEDEPEDEPDEHDDQDDDQDDDHDKEHDDEEGNAMSTEATHGAPMILAERERAPRELSAGDFVALTIRAQHGEPEARRYIAAALTESISTDVTGLLPPTYETTVIGRRAVDRPLYTAFRGRPIPSVGLNVVKPKWTTHTAGAEAATVDADATSTKVTLATQTATVKRWDWAGAIPWVVVQRSDPSIVDEIYADAVEGFYLYVEGKIGGQLLAAATGTSVTIGAALAEFYIATGNQRTAEVIVMAPDVWGKFADKSALSSSIVVGGVDGAGGFSATLAGIPVVVSGTITAAHTILATRRAVDARVTEPVRLTANAIGALNVELAVVGEGLFDTDYPAEILQFATLLPAVAEAEASSSRSSK